MKRCDFQKLIYGLFTALCLLFTASVSVYAWFFFPLTQNTSVYTDGVTEVDVKAYVYNREKNKFGESVEATGDPAVIPLNFRDNTGAVSVPYFFLWGGEYTSNDLYRTIYKIEVTYGNEAEVYPTQLRLFGEFDFGFFCLGNDNNRINLRFMKLSYFTPTEETAEKFLDPSFYTNFNETEYSEGCTVDLGTSESNPAAGQKYTITFYVMLETDLTSLNRSAELIAEEYGLLDSEYTVNLRLFCRTVPANPTSP